MKSIILLIITSVLTTSSYANKIDSLQTDKEVDNFVKKILPNKYLSFNTVFQLNRPDSIHIFDDCLNNERDSSISWKKTDFNKDGQTDLFVIVYATDTIESVGKYYAYVILAYIDNTFECLEIPTSSSFINCYSVKPIITDTNSYLLFEYSKLDYITQIVQGKYDTLNSILIPYSKDSIFEVPKSDTLIYKFGAFIDANIHDKEGPEISSILFKTEVCYGGCPVFSLLINKRGKAQYIKKEAFYFAGDEENKMKLGKYNATIPKKQLEEIVELLKYMNVKELNDRYVSLATHMRRTLLKVNFSDGSTKTIVDAGLQGTSSLSRLYHLLYNLADNTDWK